MDLELALAAANLQPLLLLATGGMATLHVARYVGGLGFERLVAVKRTHEHLRSDPMFDGFLREEARVGGLVRHPNVVSTLGLVEADGELCLVQEYVDAVTLGTLLAECSRAGERLPIETGVRIVADLLAGLHAAHEAVDLRGRPLHLVHRDVSPQNILVGADGVARLIDFGIAKAHRSVSEPTRPGVLKGKWSYMAPEQASAARLDRRTDVFAAGIVLHEVITGKRLFRPRDQVDAVRLVCESPIPSPSACRPEISPALESVVMCALDRDRERRFATAGQFLEELEAAYRPAGAQAVGSWVQRRCGERLAERRRSLARTLGDHTA